MSFVARSQFKRSFRTGWSSSEKRLAVITLGTKARTVSSGSPSNVYEPHRHRLPQRQSDLPQRTATLQVRQQAGLGQPQHLSPQPHQRPPRLDLEPYDAHQQHHVDTRALWRGNISSSSTHLVWRIEKSNSGRGTRDAKRCLFLKKWSSVE
jgi:hypothetical protein